MKSNHSKYRLSFTGASAVIELTRKVAEHYLITNDWQKTKEIILRDNLLLKRKANTLDRELREIIHRLKTLSDEEIDLIVVGTNDETQAMVSIGMFNTYSFISDFVREVVRSKYLLYERILTDSDYNKFYSLKSISHPELEKLAESTRKKLCQVMWKILEQLGFLDSSKSKKLIKPYLSEKSLEIILNRNKNLLGLFLFSDFEIKQLLNHERV